MQIVNLVIIKELLEKEEEIRRKKVNQYKDKLNKKYNGDWPERCMTTEEKNKLEELRHSLSVVSDAYQDFISKDWN